MSNYRRLAVVVLAAGEGTRMKSSLPKVLHTVGGLPMVTHVVAAARSLSPEHIVVVVGHGGERVEDELRDSGVLFARQAEQCGTGDAVRSAGRQLAGFDGSLLVVYGDNPLIRPETLERLAEEAGRGTAAAVLTVESSEPTGYGRILRDGSGALTRIVEEKDATPAQRSISEVNAGSYCFDAPKLFSLLPRLGADNNKGEHYLTDVVGMLVTAGERVTPVMAAEEWETLGVDSREKLAKANAIFRDRMLARLMAEGVGVLDPGSVWVDAGVSVGRDTVILPQTMLLGATSIGEDCRVGPCVQIEDCLVEAGATIEYAVARGSKIGEGAHLGPFCSLRPGTVVGPGAKIGTFVETKATTIGEGSKIPHLSYFGDAELGKGVNVGAGSITCNYDGRQKHRTVIEDDAFIGSDTMLVAPVRIGKGASTGAGAVVRKDVPPGGLAVGVPARNVRPRRAEDGGDGPGAKEGAPSEGANIKGPAAGAGVRGEGGETA